MKNIRTMLSSPKRIALFAVIAVLIIGLLAFASIAALGSVSNNQGIGLEKASNVALQSAGFTEAEVTGLRGHYDMDDGHGVYEIEFFANGYEYDYTVMANDGTIIEASREYKVLPGADQTPQDQPSQSGGTQEQPQTPPSQSQTPPPAAEPSGGQPSTDSQYIGVENAKTTALNHAGVSADTATFTKAKLDRDDGIYVYEIDFIADTIEYEYEINATTGTIIDFDRESIYD